MTDTSIKVGVIGLGKMGKPITRNLLKACFTVTVNNPGLTSYVVGNLAPGTYYFAVTALNSAGAESPMSNVGSKVIR